MKRPAVFFDRDNTLIANNGYLGDPAGVVLIYGAADAIARVRAMGFVAVTVSNQSGVARGKFTEEDVQAVNARLDQLLKAQNPYAVIERHEFCPYHPEAAVERYRHDSDLRKPMPGMLIRAAEQLNLDLSKSWVVGDAPRDIRAGHAAGCRTILFNDHLVEKSPAADEPSPVQADFRVASLYEAANTIERYRSAELPHFAAPDSPTEPIPPEPLSMPLSAEQDHSPGPFLESESEHDPANAGSDRATATMTSSDIPSNGHSASQANAQENGAAMASSVPSSSPAHEPVRSVEPSPRASESGSSPSPSADSAASSAAAPRKMTFAERVRSGTFQPARAPGNVITAPEKRVVIPAVTLPIPPVVEEPAPVAVAAPVVKAVPTAAAPPTVQVEEDDSDLPPLPEPAAVEIPAVGKRSLKSSAPQTQEAILLEILEEVRRVRQHSPYPDFSVTKLLAGIAQIMVLPALFFGYLHHGDAADLHSMLLLAIFLQMLTLCLLIMGKQQN